MHRARTWCQPQHALTPPHTAPGARANSFWAVGLEMARTEGVRSLAGGVSASMLSEIVCLGICMGTYEYFKDK